MRISFAVLAVVLSALAAPDAAARSFRVGQTPNGRSWTCDSCHGRSSLAPADLTPFGTDVNRTLRGGDVDWSAIWQLDSDGDGFTNGHELGDPNGTWRIGQPHPEVPTSNPGIPNEGICGNMDAEPDEACDGSDLRGETCQSLGYGEGVLSCHYLCRWDSRECGGCGDGYLNPAFEDCDRDAFLDDVTCEDFGFLRGELSCTSDCKVDSSTCTDEAPAVCGDGIISTGELCDGENLGTVDCVRIAYAGGTLRCTDQCRWDASECILEDGTRVGDEERAAADDGSTGLADVGTSTPTADAGGVVDAGAGSGQASDSGCSTIGAGRGNWIALLALIVAMRRWR